MVPAMRVKVQNAFFIAWRGRTNIVEYDWGKKLDSSYGQVQFSTNFDNYLYVMYTNSKEKFR